MPPVTFPPGATVLENLRHLAGATITDAALRRCSALAARVCAELDVAQMSEGKRINLLGYVLKKVVSEARQRVLAVPDTGQLASPDRTSPVAAAGELLGLSDEALHDDLFEKLRRRRGISDAYWHERLQDKEHRSPKRRRQLCAGVWLKERDHYSYAAARAREVELLAALEAALVTYLNRPGVTSTLIETLGLGPPSRHEAISPNNATSADRSASPVDANSWYVRREREEAEFRQLVADGVKLIVFIGQPGMGKTSLAEALARDPSTNDRAPFIRVRANRLHLSDLAEALSTHNIDPATPTGNRPVDRFINLVMSERSPRFVILDNLDSADQLNDLIPYRDTTSIVVVTCRTRGTSPPRACKFIQTDAMSLPEATQLVRSELPNVSIQDAEMLARALDGHPLVIRHACRDLAREMIDIEEFCSEVGVAAAAIARSTPTQEGATLQAVLRRSLNAIAREDALAIGLLSCISFQYLTRAADEVFLRAYAREHVGSTASAVRYAKAMGLLLDYCLLERDGLAFGLHSFTQAVLISELRGHIAKTSELALRADAALQKDKNVSDSQRAISELQTIQICAAFAHP
jgi:hypothetical protein